MNKPITLFSLEAKLKREVRSHLKKLGFSKSDTGALIPPNVNKDNIRKAHLLQRIDNFNKYIDFVNFQWPRLKNYFANGSEITAHKIKPRIEIIKSKTWQSDLFRLASLTWSIPVSQGYGRRMRFLVWDENINKLIGIIALGDPVFNLKPRDDFIAWNADDRKERLVNVLDAYVLGAIPPYNELLCGKLVACLVRTREVLSFFKNKYASKTGLISKKQKNPSLLMVTTSSALGKSSIYNRLKLNQVNYFTSVGYTTGWGHFHISNRIFSLMVEYLKRTDDNYESDFNFGDGPNWRIRTVKKTLSQIGMNPNILCHGIKREIYISELASNARKVLRGENKRPNFKFLYSVDEVAEQAIDRWILGRSKRLPNYRYWDNNNILNIIKNNQVYSSNMIKKMKF